jgi:DNA-binding SARP family transcriptional activator/tetratricopeptide (TPR) repeat protein
MRFGILGPLEVRDERGVVELGGSRPRAILAVLLLHPNEPVSAERLVLDVWGEEAPPAALKRLHVSVSRLRKALGDPDAVTTTAGGYRLRLEPDDLDAERFERLAEEGRDALAAAAPERAAGLLREALGLWRGRPLADLAFEPFAQAEIARLEEQRLAALEARVDADLAVGRHAVLVGELQRLVAAHPTRERLAAQLMLALYRCRRQADALAVYRETSARLVDELGLQPGEELRSLELRVLEQDPALEAPQRAAEPEPAPSPPATRDATRRVVSVLRAGLADAAAFAAGLDPEALHARLDGCWERCARVIERHGGAVEQIERDGIVAAFGLAELHEDDALRAVRAADELRALDGVELRVGVATGEVFVAAGARGQRFATGEPLRAAAELEGAAAAREVLIAAATRRLAAAAAEVEPAAGAWRLLALVEDVAEPVTAFVGRDAELAALNAAFERAAGEPGCRLVTVVGPPGIGKSRIARELRGRVAATVVVGRCLSYGEGITYRPLAEIVGQLDGAVDRLDARAARGVSAAVGAAAEPSHAEETAWAFRRLFEALAADRPLVVIVDDVHWAEPTLLDLLEYVAAFSTGAPLLLLCLARPELLELRPDWAAPQADRALIPLDPLPSAEAWEIARGLGAGDFAQRIVETAEGNPFFLEQLVVASAEDAGAALPPSIRAVLAARIDRLAPGERAALERAAVEGRGFHAGALNGDGVAAHLVALVRKGLIRPDRSAPAGADAFRFAHVLIREAAYDGVPKQRRAELHEAVGRWLAASPGAADEVVGYHLEQAYRYRAELGEEAPALAGEAAQRLAAGARAALLRGDFPAGVQMLERAVVLTAGDGRARCALLPALGVALLESGRLGDAERVLAEAVALGHELGDDRLEARARVERQFVRLHAGSGARLDEARRTAYAALRVLEAHGDELGQCRAWRLRAWIEWTQSHVALAREAWERAAGHAARAGEERERVEILGFQASAAAFGPTPVSEGIRICTAIREQVHASQVAEAVALRPLGLLHALNGDFEEARRLTGRANAILDELGRMHSAVHHHEPMVEMLAGRPEAAERRLRAAYDNLAAMGERALLATTAALLAQAVYAQGRLEEAEELCLTSERHADPDDLSSQLIWRTVRARVLARRGGLEEAEALAREAVAIAARTDELVDHGDALVALADVLELRGDREGAREATQDALALYERKEAIVPAERVRSREQPTSGRR